MKWFDRVFHAEHMTGDGRCPLYLKRWTLIKFFRLFGVYLHHFVGDDWSLDKHDHPKRFISIGLWGWYIEETPEGDTIYKAPWIRSFPAEHKHRLRVPSKNCWTLVIVLKTEREWGWWHEGRFIYWHSYVKGADSKIADKMKTCGD